MCLKNKIIAGLLALTLAAAIMPVTTKAATLSLDQMQALVTQLQAQIAQLIQTIASMQGTASQTASTASTASRVSTAGTESTSQSATGGSSGYVIEKWAKNPDTGECVTATGVGQPGWLIYSSQATCQAAKTSCVISGDSCVQNGKAYPLTNTCTNGATPYITLCNNYGTYCVPVIACSQGKAAVGASCNQECVNRGFASGSCIMQSSFLESRLNQNPYASYPNTIGKTADCMNCTNPGAPIGMACSPGQNDYCGCSVGADMYTGPGAGKYPFANVTSCEALCKKNGYTFGSCHVLANQTQMVCSGLNENDYIGTTDVCKSGTNWAAGCCCNSIAGRMITAITGGTNPGATGKADGQSCAAASECSSGYCSYTFCVSDSSHCGGITGSMNYADGAKASNQWLDGICRFGVWKVTDNGIGCDSFKCDNGNATCVSNKCVVSNPTAKKTNGESCAAASECSSGICSYTFCVQNSTDCGGVSGSMDYANGKFASNQWFGGYCRNGVWKVATGNIGCGGDLSFPCDSGSCVNNKCQ